MLPTLPPYPLYTYGALVVCWLIALGALCYAVSLAFRSVRHTFATVPRLLDLAGLRLFGVPLSSAGTSHWAMPHEVRASGMLTPGSLPLASWGDTTLYEPLGAHVLVCGPPRSWKSTGICLPALRAWPGAVIVSDLRHELYDATASDRAALGPVYCYDPASDTASCNLNVLDSVRWSSPQAYGDAMRICHHLVVPQRDRTPGPFDRPAVALLTGVCLHLHDVGTASLPDVCDWMLAPLRSQKEKLQEMQQSSNPHVSRAARRVLDVSERMRGAIWDDALAPLQVFLDPTIAAHSRTSDLDWTELLSGRQPVSLYLALQFRDIDRLGVILGALVEALIAVLGSPERTPRHRTLLLLDELANLGTLTELERGVSYLQGSGVQVLACVQNLPQLVSLYGLDSPLLASVHTQLHYRPLDRATAEYVEAMLGPTTILAQSWSATQGRSWSLSTATRSASVSQSQTERARPLLTAQEVRQLPFGAALVLAAGAPPILARKLGVPQPPLPVRAWGVAIAHRQMCATVAGALLLLAALAPVWQSSPAPPSPVLAIAPPSSLPPTVEASVPPPLTVPPAVVHEPVPPPPGPAWVLTAHMPGLGAPLALHQGTFSTVQDCDAALAQRWEPRVQLAQQQHGIFGKRVEVERAPHRLTWRVASAGLGVETYSAWCEEQAAAAQP